GLVLQGNSSNAQSAKQPARQNKGFAKYRFCRKRDQGCKNAGGILAWEWSVPRLRWARNDLAKT
ncbi:MAG: hypothetical protein LBR79_03230, partial [Oscillospiraceae bacterium]|nr:hypothetical protein [Oscillospiraceae bacterium]